MKKHDPQAQRIAATFVIIGCVGAVAIGVLAYYHADPPLVWVTFLTVAVFLVAIYFHWRSPGVQALCTGLGIVLFIGCLIWQYRLLPESKPLLKPQSLTASPSPNATPSSLPAPNAREFLDIDLEKLFGFFGKYNDAQAEGLVKPYIGKWMDIQGRVIEVRRDISFDKDVHPVPGIKVTIGTGRRQDKKSYIFTQAYFDEPRWADRALVLKNNEDIKIRGQLRNVFEHGLVLEHCEIIE